MPEILWSFANAADNMPTLMKIFLRIVPWSAAYKKIHPLKKPFACAANSFIYYLVKITTSYLHRDIVHFPDDHPMVNDTLWKNIRFSIQTCTINDKADEKELPWGLEFTSTVVNMLDSFYLNRRSLVGLYSGDPKVTVLYDSNLGLTIPWIVRIMHAHYDILIRAKVDDGTDPVEFARNIRRLKHQFYKRWEYLPSLLLWHPCFLGDIEQDCADVLMDSFPMEDKNSFQNALRRFTVKNAMQNCPGGWFAVYNVMAYMVQLQITFQSEPLENWLYWFWTSSLMPANALYKTDVKVCDTNTRREITKVKTQDGEFLVKEKNILTFLKYLGKLTIEQEDLRTTHSYEQKIQCLAWYKSLGEWIYEIASLQLRTPFRMDSP